MGGSKEGTGQKGNNGLQRKDWSEDRRARPQGWGRTMELEDHRTERSVEWDYGNRDVPEQGGHRTKTT